MSKEVKTAKQHAPGWRFRFGIFFFVLSLISPVFIPLVNATGLPVEWKTALSGLLVVGIPQLLTFLAIVFLGKSGFNYIKGRMIGFLKRYALPSAVSRTRYYIGLAMFLVPFLFGWLAPYAPQLLPGYEAHRFAVNFTGDLLLLISLFVLGGDFWDKVRALFVYEAKAQFPLGARNASGTE